MPFYFTSFLSYTPPFQFPTGVALRLFLPIVLICLLPTEEMFLQNLFQGEGLFRVIQCAWSFRFSFLILIKKTGICGMAFILEEILQKLFLYFLI